MTRIFLTRTGLLATNHKADNSLVNAAFFTNEGHFVRQCTISEAIYLVEEIELQPIKLNPYKEGTDLAGFMCSKLGMPKWEHVISVRVTDDSKTLNWFVSTMPNGEHQFRVVTTYTKKAHSTSAELEFDQLSGAFEQGLGKLIIENAPAEFNTLTSRNKDGDIEDHYVMLEEISEPCTFADMWNQKYLYVQRKEIISKLRDLGLSRPKAKVRTRKRR